MKKIITKDYLSMSEMAARAMLDFVKANPNANLCLPTGGSVEGTYNKLCEYAKAENISFKNIAAYNMDEYVTLSKNDESGYYFFLNKYVYSKVDIDLRNTFSPQADAENLQKACSDYTEKVNKLNGFDFTLLGIGSDGHVAFNMPKRSLYLDTHIEDLSKETIQANARYFDSISKVPTQAITIGVGIIMRSKKILLVASGKAKAKVLGDLFKNRVLKTELPASVLWMHPDVTFILDEEAASEIVM